jgi:hypothetical protein
MINTNTKKLQNKTKKHTSVACQGSIPKSSYQAMESHMDNWLEFLTVKD